MVNAAEALEWYRKLVYRIYREICAMEQRHHPELHGKSNIGPLNLNDNRKTRIANAKHKYVESISDHKVEAIDQRYAEWVGLTLQEVLLAFKDGDWKILGIHMQEDVYSYGGPKWVVITETALRLREAIVEGDWKQATSIVEEISTLRHNTDLLVKQLEELDSQ